MAAGVAAGYFIPGSESFIDRFSFNSVFQVSGEPSLVDELQVELLESRWLLSGLVAVSVTNSGDLLLGGDRLDNVVEMAVQADGSMALTSPSGTAFRYQGSTMDDIELGAGDDAFDFAVADSATAANTFLASAAFIRGGSGVDLVANLALSNLTAANLFSIEQGV